MSDSHSYIKHQILHADNTNLPFLSPLLFQKGTHLQLQLLLYSFDVQNCLLPCDFPTVLPSKKCTLLTVCGGQREMKALQTTNIFHLIRLEKYSLLSASIDKFLTDTANPPSLQSKAIFQFSHPDHALACSALDIILRQVYPATFKGREAKYSISRSRRKW